VARQIKSEFVWHAHAGEDEMFLVIRGNLAWFPISPVTLGEGDFLIYPAASSIARRRARCEILLFEPAPIRHGSVESRSRSTSSRRSDDRCATISSMAASEDKALSGRIPR
jgi:hypothetical protein